MYYVGKGKTGAIVGLVIALILLTVLIVVIIVVVKNKKEKSSGNDDEKAKKMWEVNSSYSKDKQKAALTEILKLKLSDNEKKKYEQLKTDIEADEKWETVKNSTNTDSKKKVLK